MLKSTAAAVFRIIKSPTKPGALRVQCAREVIHILMILSGA